MNFGEFMGLVAVMAAMVSIVAILTSTYKRHLLFQERKLEIMAGQTAEKAAQYASHNTELEGRVRVLERIATEGANPLDLAAQIDALRELPHRESVTQ